MPLLEGANFCVACGTSVRAGGKATRARNRSEDPVLKEGLVASNRMVHSLILDKLARARE